MLVYRVEHKRHRHGPYRCENLKTKKCKDLAWALLGDHDSDFEHPCPQEEGILMRERDYCGFISIEQAVEWFDGWLDRLHFAGYCLAVFEVPEDYVKLGERQAVFPRESYKRVDTLLLTEIQDEPRASDRLSSAA